MPGDTHGLEFPYSATMLADERTWGSTWLTHAFRKAGSIMPTNTVTITDVRGAQQLRRGGWGACLRLRYVSHA